MIITGIIKQKGYLTNIFSFLLHTVKSKKLVLFLISLFGGILPIPGRVAVSAGILDIIAPKDKVGRESYGIVDYLSTHHYYIWSPLEKTVIIPMAVLGLTYGELLYTLFPLIIISFFIITIYIFKFDNSNINIPKESNIKYNNILAIFFPFIITLILTGITNQYLIIFSAFTLYLVNYSNSWKNLVGYINWKLILSVGAVIALSNIVTVYNNDIQNYLGDMTKDTNIYYIGIICFFSSFILGSSGKYAGIVSIICSVVGIEYLLFIFTACYSGYLLSPTHKCIYIGQQYFGTPIKKYVFAIGTWAFAMLTYSTFNLIW